ncbi:hypothetical protein FOL47_009358 [Perkinsus chesapeaki]|uniref:Uncharacterized protein n=1 Tax=Perkinsus chesapeaki TaxID=330153 RepID=A0A7J6L8S3_PERCH|nr:hypothetical protein FOL47_009358 [Perkinsus chesapeaki]
MLSFSIILPAILIVTFFSGCDDDIHTGSCEFRGEHRLDALVVIKRDLDVKNGTFHLESFQCGSNPHASLTTNLYRKQWHYLADLPLESRLGIDKIVSAEGPRKAQTCRAVMEAVRIEASKPVYNNLFDDMNHPATIDGLVEKLCLLVAARHIGQNGTVTISGGYITIPEEGGYLRNVAPHVDIV